MYVFFKFAKRDITFCWVPSHVGIKGNEKANATGIASSQGWSTSYQPVYILSTWQDDWNGAVANKLHSLKSVWEIGSPLTGNAGRTKLSDLC